MDKKIERNIIWTLAILLIFIGAFGCASIAPTTTLNPKKITTLDTIANIPSIINVLGCMFAPNNPACQKDMQDKPVSALTDAELN
tara:strand:+ start:290 stop:544 length:255 start_codon:yes stop_codon:yes gene_type:complete